MATARLGDADHVLDGPRHRLEVTNYLVNVGEDAAEGRFKSRRLGVVEQPIQLVVLNRLPVPGPTGMSDLDERAHFVSFDTDDGVHRSFHSNSPRLNLGGYGVDQKRGVVDHQLDNGETGRIAVGVPVGSEDPYRLGFGRAGSDELVQILDLAITLLDGQTGTAGCRESTDISLGQGGKPRGLGFGSSAVGELDDAGQHRVVG